jgi:transcriptional regulator GlxA family with amidase domain
MTLALAGLSFPERGAAGPGAPPLKPPAKGKIRVAVLLSDGAQVIDFAGPWEVFQDVHVPGRGATMDELMPFELFTVSSSTRPITASGGLRVIPDYSYGHAPKASVILVPAQDQGDPGHRKATTEWLIAASKEADVTMSVCTGAFVLGRAGMLDGLAATTHVQALDQFAAEFPKASLIRGVRFVENEKISSSAGLSAGIDLALRVVERYWGRDIASLTASNLQYEGKGWIV